MITSELFRIRVCHALIKRGSLGSRGLSARRDKETPLNPPGSAYERPVGRAIGRGFSPFLPREARGRIDQLTRKGKTMPSTYDVARAFVTTLNDLYLSEEQMHEVRERNEDEENKNICHTHDFCDSNQAMLDALESLGVEYVPNTEIARELTYRVAERRKLVGRPVPVNGYSGRNSNRT